MGTVSQVSRAGLVVDPAVAREQLEREAAAEPEPAWIRRGSHWSASRGSPEGAVTG